MSVSCKRSSASEPTEWLVRKPYQNPIIIGAGVASGLLQKTAGARSHYLGSGPVPRTVVATSGLGLRHVPKH